MENLQSQQVPDESQAAAVEKDLILLYHLKTARQYQFLRQVAIRKAPEGCGANWITAEVVRDLLHRIARNEPVVREIQNFLGQPEDPTLSQIAGVSPLGKALAGNINYRLIARVSDLLNVEEALALNLLCRLQRDFAILPSQVVDDFGHLRLNELKEQLGAIPTDLKLLERAPVYKRDLEILEELGRASRARLISDYRPLVGKIVLRHLASGVEADDLRQAGITALMRAIDSFDFRRGVHLSSYARPAIQNEIRDVIRRTGFALEMPRAIASERRRIMEAEARLRQELQKDDVTEELCDSLEMSWEHLIKIRDSFRTVLSLDQPVGDDDSDLTLADTISDPSAGPEELVCSKLMAEKMLQALQTLPERDRRVLELRFGLGRDRELTFDELGRELGISRQAVHKTVGRALKKLRDPALGLVEG